MAPHNVQGTVGHPTVTPEDFTHRIVDVGEVNLHVAELGSGPPVVMCHGFPHLWWSWRHQMNAIAEAGFRAVAVDLRGYGGSDAPSDPARYANEAVIPDLLGLLDDMGEDQAVFAGLDFGASLVWDLALRHPDRVRAAIVLNNPYIGRFPKVPSEMWASMARKHFTHLHYFMPPGPADAALAAEPRRFLTNVYWALSGEYHYFDTWRFPHEGHSYLDVLPEAPALPWSWLSEAEMDVYVEAYQRTGFTGGLNWYRALDRNYFNNERFAGAKIEVPSFFVAGARDCDMEGFSGHDPFAAMRALVPDLRAAELVPEAGHLLQMERPAAVNALIVDWLGSL
jgi:pimeloyl-ACP methyl ester carboxylesterase